MIPQATEWTEDGAWLPAAPARRSLPKKAEEIARALVREDRRLRPGAGRLEAIAPIPLLRQRLGATTYRLWATLTTMRDPTAETHPSLPGLARAAGMSQAQTAKSLARLREFKLVEDFGFMYRMVPCRCAAEVCCTGHKVYIRNVYGQIQERGTFHYVALVPRQTLKLITVAAGQGGKRAGAGRPRTRPVEAAKEPKLKAAENKPNKSKVVAYKNQELVSQRTLTGSLPNKAPFHGACNSLTQEAGKGVQPKREALERFLSSPPSALGASPLQPKAQPAQASAAPTEAPPAPAVAGGGCTALVDGKPCDLLEALRVEGATTIEFGGGYKGPRQRYTPEDLRAASTLSNQINVLRIPAPPKVRPDQPEAERLALLKAAFRAVHEKDMRSTYWRPKRELSAKEREAQLAACEALMSKDLSPLAWARFAFLQWHRMGKKTAPTTAWVWNAARILKHAGWCHSEVGTLHTARPYPLPAATRLMERLAALRQALGWGRPTEVVVSEVLPDSERQVLLAQQRTQREAGQREIEQRINNGEWMWG